MINKTHKEIHNFTSNIKTIQSHEELLKYMNRSFYASIKLLISISSTFSIYWKVILPFIVSLSALLVLFNIEPIVKELHGILNINYILIIQLILISLTLIYISNSKKYFIFCMEKSKSIIQK